MRYQEMTFPETLAAYKTESKLTNPQIAELLGIPLRTFEDWKSGRHIPPEYVRTAVESKLNIKAKEER